jgi:hypothetical protein
MPGKVTVCCSLPHGIVLQHPQNPKITVVVNGLNKATIIGASHATTEIDADIWEAWKAEHKDFPAIKAGALFSAKTADEAKGKMTEMKDEKTGFESMPQNAMGIVKEDGK